jgi:hypothetical protein
VFKNILLACPLLFTSVLTAQEIAPTDNYSYASGIYTNGGVNEDQEVRNFFTFDVSYDYITNSKIKSTAFRNEDLQFSHGTVLVSYVYFLDCLDAISVGAGDTYDRLSWNGNIYFNRRDYNSIDFLVGGFTKRLRDWTWKGSLLAQVDSRYFKGNYTFYTSTIWGRYSWDFCFCHDFGFDIGGIYLFGLKHSEFVPIIGFDFKLWDRIQINAIYPVNLSISYAFNCNWSVAVAGRIWEVRHKLYKDEPLPQGYFTYRNSGIELALNYNYDPIVTANVHVGSTLGSGTMKITNYQNHDPIYVKYKAAFYAGGEVTVHF